MPPAVSSSQRSSTLTAPTTMAAAGLLVAGFSWWMSAKGARAGGGAVAGRRRRDGVARGAAPAGGGGGGGRDRCSILTRAALDTRAGVGAAERSRVVVTDPSVFAAKQTQLLAGGADQLQVIADFDRTITLATVNGKRGASCHGVVESLQCLSVEYRSATDQLFKKYFPLEITPDLSIEEKIPIMQEWYGQAHDLLLKERVTPVHLEDAVHGANLALRGGVCAMIATLQAHDVPLLIFSAGIANVITEVMKQKFGPLKESTHIISNWMEFNDANECVAFTEPLIHMFNKNESQTRGTDFAQAVAERKNVILLGDGLGDVTMADGIPHNVVLKVGFLNEKVSELMPKYREVYDVIITHDGDMDLVAELVATICAQQRPVVAAE